MRLTVQWAITTLEVLLVCPAVLFMTALFMRNVQPQTYEPAHTAQEIVLWYSYRPRMGLWLLLIMLPLGAFLAGCSTLWRRWQKDAELRTAVQTLVSVARLHLATLLTATASLAAAGVLGIVAIHVLTD